MNRVAFPYVLQSPSSGSAIPGATATITQNVPGAPTLGGGAPAQIYTTQQGGSALAGNQITTDNLGRWTQGASASYAQYWLPEGTYDVVVTGSGLTTFAVTRELWSGTHVVEQGLVATAVQNGAYTANPQDAVPVDISASTFTVTLPTAPADGTRVQVKVVKVNAVVGTFVAHVTCGGTDVLNIAGGVTGLTLTALGQGVVLKYQASTKIWLTVADTPLGVAGGAASLDATSNVPAAQLGNILTGAQSQLSPTPNAPARRPNVSRPTLVAATFELLGGTGQNAYVRCGPTSSPTTQVASFMPSTSAAATQTLTFLVPPGYYYDLSAPSSTILTVTEWTL